MIVNRCQRWQWDIYELVGPLDYHKNIFGKQIYLEQQKFHAPTPENCEKRTYTCILTLNQLLMRCIFICNVEKKEVT